MHKYSLLRQRVMQAGLPGGEALREPTPRPMGKSFAPTTPHIGGGWSAANSPPPRSAKSVFAWTPRLVERLRRSAGATIEACRAALEEGIGVNLAGADPCRDDRLGRLALSKESLRARYSLVPDLCRTACLPVAIVMAYGYARKITDTVDIHFSTVEVATQFQCAAQQSHASSPTEMR